MSSPWGRTCARQCRPVWHMPGQLIVILLRWDHLQHLTCAGRGRVVCRAKLAADQSHIALENCAYMPRVAQAGQASDL